MAEDIVRTGIQIDIDTASAVNQLNALEQQISQFNTRIVSSNDAMRTALSANTKLLQQQIGDLGQFSTQIRSIQTDVGRFSTALEKGKLSFGEYFRYGMASTKTFGKAFTKELDLINATAEDRVKRLSTRYVALGKQVDGMQKVLAIRPEVLPQGMDTQLAMAAQKQQIFNQLLRQGSTHLVNWGKNTQWAGRQLMVGFTIPLTIFGGIASKVFMDLERQAINFRRVYGDAFTPAGETDAMLEQVKGLSIEFTKYGISASETMDMAAKAAATGAQGADLLAQTTEATRLATLGQIDQQQALDATIALQSAFALSATELAEAVNFLNAVENQTVVSLDDVTQAIPRAATVIQGLGGDVQDLAAFLAAMRENGVNAAEGANALKSGLASLINPTKQAREQLEAVGIDIQTIIETNRGDLMGTVQAFAQAVNALDPLTRQQTLAQVFGKYQFARLGALFENITKDGSQASRVLQLMGDDVSNLAALADKELGTIEDAIGVKFQGAVERLKIAIAPIGEIFLRIATPVVEAATKIVDAFNSMPDGVKTAVAAVIAILAGIAPVFLMGIGLIGNGIGNMIKGFDVLRGAYQRMTGKVTGAVGPMTQSFGFMTDAELDAAAAANSLDANLAGLTGTALINRDAIDGLTGAYVRFAGAMNQAAMARPQGVMATPRMRGMARGGFVGGKGNKDSEPALLMPGEFVVTKDATEKYAPILVAMNQGKLAGYAEGTPSRGIPRFLPERASAEDLQSNRALYEFGHAAGFAANELKTTVSSLSETADRIRDLGNNASEADLAFLDLLDTVLESEKTFVRMEEAADGSWRATEVATKALKDLSTETGAASLGQFAGGKITSGTRNEALKQIGVDEPISFDNLRVAAEAAEQKLLAVANGAAEMQMPYQYALQAVIDEYNELRGDLQAQSRYLLDNAQAMIRDGLMTDRKMDAEQALAISLEKRQDIEEMLARTGAVLNGEIRDSTRAQQVVEAMLLRQADALAISINPQVARRAAMSASSASGIGRVVQPRQEGSRSKVFASPATRTSVAQALQELGIEIGNDVNRYLVPSIEAGVSAGLDVGSPPPWSFQLGEWIAEGIQIGAKQQSERFATAYPSMPLGRMQPDPRIAANLQSMRPMGVAEPSSMVGAFEVDPEITRNLEEMGLSAGKAAVANEKDATASILDAGAHLDNAEATNLETKEKRKGVGGFRSALYALDGLSLAMSFLPGPLGEIANKVFIASAALSAFDAIMRIQIIDGALKRFGAALSAAAAASGLKAAGQGVTSAVSTGADVATAAALARGAGPAGKVGGVFAKMLGPLTRVTAVIGKLLPAIGRLALAAVRFVGVLVNGVPIVGQVISALLLIGSSLLAFKFAFDHTGNQIKDLGNAAKFAGDELQSLADRFGFQTRGRTGIDEPTVLGAARTQEAVDLATEARAAVQEDEALRQRAETVGRASDINAEAVFRSMFADLLDQGAPRDVAVSIVAAVAEEAGKQDVFVPVRAELEASFDDEGKFKDLADFMSSQLAPAVQGVNQDLIALQRTGMGDIVDQGAIDDARRWFAITESLPDAIKKVIIPQYAQKKAIMDTASSMEILGTSVSTGMGLLNSQFASGEITAKEFKNGISGIKTQLDTLPQSQGLKVMQQQLIALYPQLETNISGIDDATLAFQLLQGAAMGVDMSGFISQLSAAGATASQVAGQVAAVIGLMSQIGGVQGQIATLEAEKAAAKAQERSATDPKDTSGSGGSKDPFAAREDELRDQQAEITIKEIKIDRQAEDRLEDRLQDRFGRTSITIGDLTIDMETFEDVEYATTLIGEQIEDIERGPLKQYEDQVEAINDEIEVYQEQLDAINRDIDLQQQAIRRIEEEYKPVLDSLEAQKDAQEDILRGLEDQRDAAIRPYEDQIAILERQLRVAEQAAKPRLDALEDEEEALDVQSKALDDQIDYIDEQKDALSEVAKLNEYIARQQKNRLGLTQALAEGDIYAATAAANQMKQDAADEAAEQQQNAFDAQKDALQEQKDLIDDRREAIDAERDAIQEGLDAIQDQIDAQEYQKFLIEDSYRLSIRAAEDSIRATDREISRQTALRDARIKPYQDIIDNYAPRMDAINNAIYEKEKEINKIQKENIKPLEDRIAELETQRDLLDDIVGDVQLEIERDKAALARRKEYLDQELQILSARREIADLETGGGGGGGAGQAGITKWTKEDEAELQKLKDKVQSFWDELNGILEDNPVDDGGKAWYETLADNLWPDNWDFLWPDEVDWPSIKDNLWPDNWDFLWPDSIDWPGIKDALWPDDWSVLWDNVWPDPETWAQLGDNLWPDDWSKIFNVDWGNVFDNIWPDDWSQVLPPINWTGVFDNIWPDSGTWSQIGDNFVPDDWSNVIPLDNFWPDSWDFLTPEGGWSSIADNIWPDNWDWLFPDVDWTAIGDSVWPDNWDWLIPDINFSGVGATLTGFFNSTVGTTEDAPGSETILGKLNGIKQWFMNLPTNIQTFITQTIPSFFDTLVGNEEEGVGVLGKVSKIKKFFTNLPANIKTFITEEIPAFFQTLVGNEEEGTGVMGKIGKIKKFFTNLPTNIQTFITETIPNYFGTLVGSEEEGTGALGKLAAIKTFFSELPSKIATFITEGIPNIFQTAWDGEEGKEGIKDKLEKIFTFFKDLPGRVAGFIGNIGSDLAAALNPLKGLGVGPGSFAGGEIQKRSMGGTVFGNGTRDSVPAILAPGEFVIRKAMVDKYGLPMFESINQGSFSMPKYSVGKSTAGNVDVKAQNTANIVAPMYNNYSVNVSVSNSNASADEIANKTIMKIKQMQNMQIRSNRGY